MRSCLMPAAKRDTPDPNAHARHRDLQRIARRRTKHELLGGACCVDQQEPRAVGRQHAHLHAAIAGRQFLGQFACRNPRLEQPQFQIEQLDRVGPQRGRPRVDRQRRLRRKDQAAGAGRQRAIGRQTQLLGIDVFLGRAAAEENELLAQPLGPLGSDTRPERRARTGQSRPRKEPLPLAASSWLVPSGLRSRVRNSGAIRLSSARPESTPATSSRCWFGSKRRISSTSSCVPAKIAVGQARAETPGDDRRRSGARRPHRHRAAGRRATVPAAELPQLGRRAKRSA